ncbi:PfkB family carbohydrate kinase [Fusibacter ferrireducens]|uniref:Carbohydrate kinase n=1 Tax=Fusibacter ferrireducens TaxID=2785058 RepID=A0ABR9ZM60_9FIRM|nr:PfkB family carbohydrate kinase [Fusibacter ferrireducens]MBF4691550.1 carbohydrate kinase [Fusibacter ferrireducens]
MKIIGIGDNVVDVYIDQNVFYPGGNCVNVLVNAKRNGAEKASYLGIFGTDDAAEHIKYALKQEHISFDFSRTTVGKSGHPGVNINALGDRVFVGGPRDTVQHIVKLNLTENDLDYIKGFDVAHVSRYSSMESELEKLSKVISVSYDFSNGYSEAYLSQVCPFIDYAFLSAADLSDEAIEELLKTMKPYNLKVIGITRGAQPAIFIYNDKRYIQEPVATQVVDTMGAGDSFIGGFLRAFMDGEPIETALALAASSAAKTCGFHGGFGYPKNMTS